MQRARASSRPSRTWFGPALAAALIAWLLLPAVAVSAAAPRGSALGAGAGPVPATDPSTGRHLVVWTRLVTDGDGTMSGELVARPVTRGGRPAGTARRVAGGLKPDLVFSSNAQPVSVAVDPRRHRYLVAYTAHKPGMGSAPCPPSAPTFPPLPSPVPCLRLDVEVFARVLDAAGRPVGDERRVSDVGPADQPQFVAAAPSVGYDARSDSFLLTYAGTITGEDLRGALLAQRLDAGGAPAGAATQLALQPTATSFAPQSRLAADPRGGYLLAYSWGQEATARALFAQRLDGAGAIAGPPQPLPTPPGGGTGSVDLAFDTRRRRALVVSSTSAPGSSGFQAQQINASGAAATSPVRLRLGEDRGLVVTAGPRRGTWLYGIARRGRRLTGVALLRTASATGRPGAAASAVTPSDGSAALPGVSVTPRGDVLVTWADERVRCRGDACVGSQDYTVRERVLAASRSASGRVR